MSIKIGNVSKQGKKLHKQTNNNYVEQLSLILSLSHSPSLSLSL